MHLQNIDRALDASLMIYSSNVQGRCCKERLACKYNMKQLAWNA